MSLFRLGLGCLVSLLPALASAQQPVSQWVGAQSGDGMGYSVAFLGDANADGFDDWLIGAPGTDTAGNGAGQVQLVSGLDDTLIWSIDGPGVAAGFGYAIAAAGDIDADGVPDVVVGAPLNAVNGFLSGSAFVLSGADGSVLHAFHGSAPGHNLGQAVSASPDLNADGIQEIVVGAPGAFGERGLVRVFSGFDAALLWEVQGTEAGSRFGFSVAGVGDATGDGFPDVLVGAPKQTVQVNVAGAAHLLSGVGGSIAVVFAGEDPGGHFGTTVASAGDIDADGVQDLLVGAPEAVGYKGRVRVLSGALRTEIKRLEGQAIRGRLGSSLAAGSDVSGDGVPDFVIGARTDWQGGLAAGAFLVFSSEGVLLAEVLGQPGAYLGYSVASGGDANGDGLADFVVGAWRDYANQGSATLYTFADCPGSAPYCGAGTPGEPVMDATGAPSVSADAFALHVAGAPPGALGIFFCGPVAAFDPFGAGTVCVGAGANGLVSLFPVLTVMNDGSASRALGLGGAADPALFTTGSAWSFQFSYFDPNAGNAQRFSSAIRVHFCP